MVMASSRCRECHGKMNDEWTKSSHSRSASSVAYKTARAQAAKPKKCDRCHVPLRGHVPAGTRAEAEGITCDVCHTIKSVRVGPFASSFTMRVTDAVKYGAYCDAKDHYFHRMACAKSQTDGTLCAACHQLSIKTQSGIDLPVYTTYEDWKKGPANEDGMACQHCHMPSVRGEAAVGAGERPQVRDHGFMGKAGKLRTQAASLEISVANKAKNTMLVSVGVKNSGAGHYIPSGLPARRLVVRIRSLDSKGAQLDVYERTYGRVLVSAQGDPTPYYKAFKLLRDTRIAPRTTTTLSHILKAPGAGKLHVSVWWRRFDHAIAKAMGVAPGKDELMIEHHIDFGAPGKRGLPKKPVIVKP